MYFLFHSFTFSIMTFYHTHLFYPYHSFKHVNRLRHKLGQTWNIQYQLMSRNHGQKLIFVNDRAKFDFTSLDFTHRIRFVFVYWAIVISVYAWKSLLITSEACWLMSPSSNSRLMIWRSAWVVIWTSEASITTVQPVLFCRVVSHMPVSSSSLTISKWPFDMA